MTNETKTRDDNESPFDAVEKKMWEKKRFFQTWINIEKKVSYLVFLKQKEMLKDIVQFVFPYFCDKGNLLKSKPHSCIEEVLEINIDAEKEEKKLWKQQKIFSHK